MADLAKAYYQQIADLCGREKKGVHWNYSASIITPGGDQMVDKVLSFDISKDYEKGFTDHMVMDATVLKKFYIENIYPVRNNFKVNVIMTQVMEREGGIRLSNPEKIVKQYRGVLVDPVDLGNNRQDASNAMSNEDQNKGTKFVSVKIQLLDLIVEQAMKMSFGGLFHGVPGTICKAMLTEAGNMIGLKGVDMPEPHNNEKVFDVIVPHGTRIIDLPRYIQQNCFGIYNHDLGSYIHDKNWFLYPIYDHVRYKSAVEENKVTISVLPPIYMVDNKRTYAVNSRHVNVICSGDVDLTDMSNAQMQNLGNGITYFDTSKLKQDSIKKDTEGVYIDPKEAKKQLLAKNADTGLDIAPYVAGRLTSSLSNMAGTIARRNSLAISFVWNYANPYLLTPGMPAKVVYYKGNKRYEVLGTLLKQVALVHPEGTTMSVTRYNTSVGLVVLLDRMELKEIEQGQYGGNKGNSGGR